MFDSCSTNVRLCSTPIGGTKSNKSRTKRQESNRVEQLASVGTSRGDAELSEKSYDIKIGSVVAENELKTSPYAISPPSRLQKLGVEQESNGSRRAFTHGDVFNSFSATTEPFLMP